MKPTISVVIPTYNEEKGIEKFLTQFKKQTLSRNKFEIIVVDGNSTDKTREIARKYADKVIIQTGTGIPNARNEGFFSAKADYIATTDADTIVPKIWLERIFHHFEKNKNIIAVIGPDGPIKKTLKNRIFYGILQKAISFGRNHLNMYGTGGTNTAIRKKTFVEIGGYKNWAHSDDIEIGFRLKNKGKIVFDKDLYVLLSTRRLEKQGYLKTLFTWAKGLLYILLGKELKSKKQYFRTNYDK